MSVVVGLVAGLGLGLALIRYTRARPWRRELRILAIGLVVAAFVYVALAVTGGASEDRVALEVGGLLLFGGVAWAGFARWPVVLALGWAAHVFWDVLLHVEGAGATYTPAWYPPLCVSFDLVVAGTILWRVPRPAADSP